MLDFTSALYLGLRHPSRELRPWPRLTAGVPAALVPPPGSTAAGARLAALQGCERATLGTSTLHLFWDFFGLLPPREFAVYLDAGAYAVAGWGAERAAGRGVTVRGFTHYAPDALRRQLRRDAGKRPVVVADGFCPACGRPAPVRELLEAARSRGGYLVLDDTQALGVFGRPAAGAPYGVGGGGSLRRAGVRAPDAILISSLAKGFGVPLAALSGSAALVGAFESRSLTRVHCSPPSVAAVRATELALAVNDRCGEALRARLGRLVRRFQTRLAQVGLSATGGLFPVQTVAPLAGLDAVQLHESLLADGVRTVLLAGRDGRGARVGFLLTARHSLEDVERGVEALARAARAWGVKHSANGR